MGCSRWCVCGATVGTGLKGRVRGRGLCAGARASGCMRCSGKPLFLFKFYEYAENISAAWIWTRIRRIGRSRKSMMQEELGYIEGGSLTLVRALMDAIEAHGGRIHLGRGALRVVVEDGKVMGVETAGGVVGADAVISTVPTPLVGGLVPDLPEEWKARYASIHNIGVICVIFRLARSVSPHFWVNIMEPELEISGGDRVLRGCGMWAATLWCMWPYYMPVTNVKFGWSDEQLLETGHLCVCSGSMRR